MYFSNLPLGARIALCAANETVQRCLGIEQPELCLESHKRFLEDDDGTRIVFITKYSTVNSNRNRISVRTTLVRERPRWSSEVSVKGSVRLEFIRNRNIQKFEESFAVVWVDGPDPLDTIFYYPSVVFK